MEFFVACLFLRGDGFLMPFRQSCRISVLDYPLPLYRMDWHLIPTFLQENAVQLIAAAVTFLWVYFEIKASMWMWPLGVLLPLLWIYLSIESRFYGNVAVNAYYLITTIIGWIIWARNSGEQEGGRIRTLSLKLFLLSLVGMAIVSVPVYGLLSNCWCWFDVPADHCSSLPWADTLATLVSFVGMVWLALKVREQWLCWFVANILSAVVFFHAHDWISGATFAVNVVLSVIGYGRWWRMQKAQMQTA